MMRLGRWLAFVNMQGQVGVLDPFLKPYDRCQSTFSSAMMDIRWSNDHLLFGGYDSKLHQFDPTTNQIMQVSY
jgi:hypothetical protein